MPDETQTPPDTNAPSSAEAANPSTPTPASNGNAPRVFSQEEVNRIAANAREEGRKAATKATPVAPSAAPPAPQATTQVAIPADDGEPHMTPKQMRDAFNEMQLRMRFEKQAAKRGVDDAAAEDLFALYKVQKPADDTVWFDEKAARFGFNKGQSAAPTAQTASATAPLVPVPPVGPPISDKGSPAPGSMVSYERELAENPVGMSSAAYALMVTKLGEEKARRTRVEAAMARQGNMRVTVK